MVLSYQYLIEVDFFGKLDAHVRSVSGGEMTHGLASFYDIGQNGGVEKQNIHLGTRYTPLTIVIDFDRNARPWLNWFKEVEEKGVNKEIKHTVSIHFLEGSEKLITWIVYSAYPTKWSIQNLQTANSSSVATISMDLNYSRIEAK